MSLRAFQHCGLKRRMTNGGHPIQGWSFMTPEERERVKERSAKARALVRDSGQADTKLRKF